LDWSQNKDKEDKLEKIAMPWIARSCQATQTTTITTTQIIIFKIILKEWPLIESQL